MSFSVVDLYDQPHYTPKVAKKKKPVLKYDEDGHLIFDEDEKTDSSDTTPPQQFVSGGGFSIYNDNKIG